MAGDHKCPVCNATFTRPQHVARHMRSHTGDRPYKCQHCGDQFARSDLLSRHVNKCHASEKPPTTTAPNRRKGSASASRATTSKQACDQCVVTNLPCDGSNPCSKCISRKCRCTFVKFHRQTAPVGPGHPTPAVGGEKNLLHPQFSMDSIIPSEEYLLSNPQHAAATIPGLTSVGAYSNVMPSSEFTFAGPLYSRSSSLPTVQQANSHSSANDGPDFATRFRAQAELLSRAGVMPNGGISIPSLGSGNGLGADTVQSSQQLYNNHEQRYPLSSASWGNGRQSDDDPMDGVLYPNNRQSDYPSSQPSSFSSSNSDLYNFRYGNRDSIDDLSDSEHGHSEQGHSSSDQSYYDSPSLPQHVPSHIISSREKPSHEQHPEGFSSAFGLMSLDDPNILAGIAADGTPFFTHINANGDPGQAVPLPQLVREDMMGGLNRKHGEDGSNKITSSAGGITPREHELRELRDFWRTYMNTPLNGPQQSAVGNGFPLATPTPNNLHGHGQLESRPSPGRKLSRVASLPSVKTPPLQSNVGPLGHNDYQSFGPTEGTKAQPPRGSTYAQSQPGADDLRGYERAVLARKTPTTLNLPRRRPGTSNGMDHSNGGRFSDPSTTASSPFIPPQNLRAGSESSPSSAESSDGGASTRPSFKRLSSTTIGPPNTKRTLLSVNGDEWESTDGPGDQLSRSNISSNGRRGSTTAELTPAMLNFQISALAAQDRHRRMSEPVPPLNMR